MKRIYASFVGIFILPPLVLLLLLDLPDVQRAVGASHALRAIAILLAFSRRQHPEFWWQVLATLAAGYLLVAVVDAWSERWCRSAVARFAAAVQPETASGASDVTLGWDGPRAFASARGRIRQRDVSAIASMSCAYRNDYGRVTISMACEPPWAFRAARRSAASGLLETLGETHVPAGDDALDARLVFDASDRGFTRWVRGPEVRRALLDLTGEDGVSTIEARPDEHVLEITGRVGGLGRVPVLERITDVLERASALADALEGYTRSARDVEPRSAGEYPARGARPHRRHGAALIGAGVVLMLGLPPMLFLGLGGRPTPALGSVFAVLPLVGLGMTIAGVVRWRQGIRARTSDLP